MIPTACIEEKIDIAARSSRRTLHLVYTVQSPYPACIHHPSYSTPFIITTPSLHTVTIATEPEPSPLRPASSSSTAAHGSLPPAPIPPSISRTPFYVVQVAVWM